MQVRSVKKRGVSTVLVLVSTVLVLVSTVLVLVELDDFLGHLLSQASFDDLGVIYNLKLAITYDRDWAR